MTPMMALMMTKAPKILAPIVYLASRICACFSPGLEQRPSIALYRLWRLKDDPSAKCRKGLSFPRSADAYGQLHGGMDAAAHLEGAGGRKDLINILARRPLVGLEQAADIDLV